MHELLLRRDVIHADETTCQVLREKGKAAESTSYMWIYLSGSDGHPPIVLYEYQAGRNGDFPKTFLEDFCGIVQCDGYSGYNKVEDVILAVCSAHCRRKFYEALPAERWIETLNPLGGSKLEKAVNYAINHKETLCNYLQDGRCELSNNAAERRAKAYAIGRKNSLFHTSVAGANASALVYSMIETAKANKLNVFQYLYVVLLYMPEYKDNPDAVKQLLPWSDYIKEHCKGLIDVEAITPENKPPLPL